MLNGTAVRLHRRIGHRCMFSDLRGNHNWHAQLDSCVHEHQTETSGIHCVWVCIILPCGCSLYRSSYSSESSTRTNLSHRDRTHASRQAVWYSAGHICPVASFILSGRTVLVEPGRRIRQCPSVQTSARFLVNDRMRPRPGM